MFILIAKDNNARVGKLHTAHGTIETPFCMPVATKATAKHVSPQDLVEMRAKAIICNAMLLHFAPGSKFLHDCGGIHKFMQYPDVIFTDSGGFQMQRKSLFLSITDKGVWFRDPFILQKVYLRPEDVMQIEQDISSDVAMVLDHMPHVTDSNDQVADAVKRTHAWAKKCKEAHAKIGKEYGSKQLLFGIAQGGLFKDLREKSAKFINALDFDGIAMGGLALGEGKKEMWEMIDTQLPFIDKEKPRYLMGVGNPVDLIEAVSRGVDCFDSIYPTQNARHRNVFTMNGMLKLDKQIYRDDTRRLDEDCDCYVCKTYTRAYLYHLARVDEHILHRYLSYHNLYFLQRFMERMREAIKKQEFTEFKKDFLASYQAEKKA
ncbi:tRNA guanosine(34) transglycosylase Tgt [Candidatus Woesearchaeota archaeon]|nr:tRNA guanosine(34) transglycosylase Tgt [Candidatus Woesearchaeota archaeon]